MADIGQEGLDDFQDRIDELGDYLFTTLINSAEGAAQSINLSNIGKNLTAELTKGLNDVQVDKILTEKLLKNTKVQKVMTDIQKKVEDGVSKITFKINNIELPAKPLFIDAKANTVDLSNLPKDATIKLSYDTTLLKSQLEQVKTVEGSINYTANVIKELGEQRLDGVINYSAVLTEPIDPSILQQRGTIQYKAVEPEIDVPSLNGNINYVSTIEKPKVDPLTGVINYKGSITEPTIVPLKGIIDYQGKITKPKVDLLKGIINYESNLPESATVKILSDVSGFTNPVKDLDDIKVVSILSNNTKFIDPTKAIKDNISVSIISNVSKFLDPTKTIPANKIVNIISNIADFQNPLQNIEDSKQIKFISNVTGFVNPLDSVDSEKSINIKYSVTEPKLPTFKALELVAKVISIDTTVVEKAVDKFKLIVLNAAISGVDTSLLLSEISKLSPLKIPTELKQPTTDIKPSVSDVEIPKIEDINASVSYTVNKPDVPVVEDQRPKIIYDVVEPKLIKEQNIKAILEVTNVESVIKSIESRIIKLFAKIINIDIKEAQSKLPIVNVLASISDVITTNIKPQTTEVTATVTDFNTDLIKETLSLIQPVNTTVSDIGSINTLTSGMSGAGDAAKNFVNLITEANKKTSITLEFFNKIKAAAEELVKINRIDEAGMNRILDSLKTRLKGTEQIKVDVDTSAIDEAVTKKAKLKNIKLKAVLSEVDTSYLSDLISKITPIKLSSILNIDQSQVDKFKEDFIVLDTIIQIADKTELEKLQNTVIPIQASVTPTTQPATPPPAQPGTATQPSISNVDQLTKSIKSAFISAIEDLNKAGVAFGGIVGDSVQQGLSRIRPPKVFDVDESSDLMSAIDEMLESIKKTRIESNLINKNIGTETGLINYKLQLQKQLNDAQGAYGKMSLQEKATLMGKLGIQYQSGMSEKQINEAIANRIVGLKKLELLQQDVKDAADDYSRAMMTANSDKLIQDLTVAMGITEDEVSQRALTLANRNNELLLQGKLTAEQKKEIAANNGLTKADIESLKRQNTALRIKRQEIDATRQVAKLQADINDQLDEYKSKWQGIKATVSAIFSNPALAKGIIFASSIQIMNGLIDRVNEFKEVGMGAGEAVNATFKSFSISSVLGLSKSVDVTKVIAAEFGNLNALTKDQIHSVGVMASNLGISGEEATNVVMAMGRMPGMTRETASNSEAMVKSIAKSKGVIPGQLMKEMAKNTQYMAIYSKGGAEGFMRAAAEAKKMGVEMSSILNAARKTLDFESSVSAEMEASALIGRNLNMDALRRASLAGDAEAIMREQNKLLQQAGGLERLNTLQKEKLAEAMGLTVEEMVKMNEQAKFQNKYFGEQASIFDNIVGNVIKYGTALGSAVMQYGPLVASIISLILQQKMLNVVRAQGVGITGADTAATTGNTIATRISAAATGAWNFVKSVTIGLLRATGVLWIADKAYKLASAAATGILSTAETAGNVVRGAWITLTNTKTVAEARSRIAKVASTAATYAMNLAEGAGAILKRGIIALLGAERVAMIASTISKWANVGANNALATSSTRATASSRGLGASLASLAVAKPAVPVILALGAAILMIGAGIAVAAMGLAQLVASFKELSGGQIAGALAAIVVVMGGFVAIIYAMVPAITALAGATGAAAIPMLAFGAAVLLIGAGVALAAYGMSKLVESFKGLSPEQAIAAAVSIGAMALAFYALSPALIAVASSATVSAGPLIALGAAVLLLGAGIALAAYGLSFLVNSLKDIKPDVIMATGAAFMYFSAGLGVMSLGLAALALTGTAGILVLLALGGAMLLLGKGLQMAGEGVMMGAVGMKMLVDTAKNLKPVISELMTLKAAIDKLNESLSKLAIMSIMSNIGLAGISGGAPTPGPAPTAEGSAPSVSAVQPSPGPGVKSAPATQQTTTQPTQLAQQTQTKGGDVGALVSKIDELIAALRAGGSISIDGRQIAEIVMSNINSTRMI